MKIKAYWLRKFERIMKVVGALIRSLEVNPELGKQKTQKKSYSISLQSQPQTHQGQDLARATFQIFLNKY